MKQNSLFTLIEFNPFRREWCETSSDFNLKPGELVVVDDGEGEDLGKIIVLDNTSPKVMSGVVTRRASNDDLATWAELKKEAHATLKLFRSLQNEFKLNMKVLIAHWHLDRKKVCFYFVTEYRLNFRKFHKALANALKAKYSTPATLRVAIKQVGLRDYVRFAGGIGVCGRIVCCKEVLTELKPITLRMARQQHLFVEPAKISGLCGKLLCCLAYEEELYQELLKNPDEPTLSPNWIQEANE